MSDGLPNIHVLPPRPLALTPSGRLRLGCAYQDVQALDILRLWLENIGQFEWVKVEADDKGSLDDVQVKRSDGTLEAWQVKFSTNPNSPSDAWTWQKLLEGADSDAEASATKGRAAKRSSKSGQAKSRRRSLLQKWCDTWEEAKGKEPQFEAGLLSNRRAAPELAQVLVDAPTSRRAAKVARWEKIPAPVRKRIASQLGGAARAREFLSAFRFCLEEPGLDELEAGAYRRFERLGGTPGGWSRLERAMRTWAEGKDYPLPDGRIRLQDVYRASGLLPNPVRLSTFRPPTAFFQSYLEPERAFHHAHALVGRREPLRAMLEFVQGSKQVAILPGRGGNGKTRLLLALCRKLARRHPDLCVRLSENLELTHEAVHRELPDAGGLVIVDDAHRVRGLEVLLAAANQNPKLQVLLVSRPHATAYLVAQARYAGIDGRQIEEWPALPSLSYPGDIQRLARRALGRGWSRYAHELASATRDCPLLTVLGGKLLRERQVPPALLVQDKEFRDEVLARFRDITLGHFAEQGDGQFPRELCLRVLPLIAVASPLPLDNRDLLEALAALAQTDQAALLRLIDGLSSAGVLARVGSWVRIVPDVLSDFILEDACYGSNGHPTGWAPQVFEKLADVALDSVLRSLAELDWRRGLLGAGANASTYAPSGESLLLREVWQQIEEHFRAANLSGRAAWLRRLERISFMQPAALWRIVEIALHELPAADEDGEQAPRWARPTTRDDVLGHLSPLLRGIACDERFTARCAEILWELSRDREAKPGTSPSAFQALSQLASYQRGKPFEFQRIVLRCCQRWARDPKIWDYRQSLLDVAAPMLARTFSWSHMDGRRLRYGSFDVEPGSSDPLRALRQGAMSLRSSPECPAACGGDEWAGGGNRLDVCFLLGSSGSGRWLNATEHFLSWSLMPHRLRWGSLLEQGALSGRRPVVLSALKYLEEAITERGLFEISERDPDARERWASEQFAAIEIVSRVATSNNDPFVRLKIWEVLHWQAERGPRLEVRQRARQVLDALPHSFESRFVLVFCGQHAWDSYARAWEEGEPGADDDCEVDNLRHTERGEKISREVVAEWVQQFPLPHEGFEALEKWIRRIEESGWRKLPWTHFNAFLLRLASDFPSYARAWCETGLDHPNARLSAMCLDLLWALGLQDARLERDLARRFLDSRDPALAQAVAHSLSRSPWPRHKDEPLSEHDWQMTRELLTFEHSTVRHAAAEILSNAANTDAPRALEMMLEVHVGEDAELAEKLCGLFDRTAKGYGLKVQDLSPAQLQALLGKLAGVSNLGGYQVGRVLRHVATRDPVDAAHLLMSRVQHHIALRRPHDAALYDDEVLYGSGDKFDVLPRSGFYEDDLQAIASHPDHRAALRLLRDGSLGRSMSHWEAPAAKLFRLFSLGYGEAGREVLNEWIESGEEAKLRGVVRLLEWSGMSFCFEHAALIGRLLRRAHEQSQDLFEEIEGSLLRHAEQGPPGAAASHRGEVSHAMFFGAQKALEQAPEEGEDELGRAFLLKMRDRGQEHIQREAEQDAEDEMILRS